MTRRKPLEWTDDGVPLCDECDSYLQENFYVLIASFASVGIEHGKGTREMAEIYFEGYHRRGHVAVA